MRRSLFATMLAFLMLGVVGVTPAAAAPPSNDDFDNATVIPSLPFTDTVDTTEATLAPDDPRFCFGGETTVWYQFTPTEDARLVANTFGSDYDAAVEVFTGTRGNLNFVNCGSPQVIFDALAGETYFFMVNSCCGGPGGSLVFNLLEAPPPLELTVSIDPVGSVTQFGTATVSGTVTCSRPVGVDIFGSVEQRAGQFIVRAGFFIFVECDGTTAWSATVRPDSRIFKPSSAFVSVFARAFDPEREEEVTASAEATVRLKRSR